MDEPIKASGLAEAVEKVAELARAGQSVPVQHLTCLDGRGGVLAVPVAFLNGADGQTEAYSLVDELAAGAAYARKARLADATGPDFRAGVARLQTIASFSSHANRFKSPASAVWADEAGQRLISVLDYHPEGHASPAAWQRHRGVYDCPLSEAWGAWGGGLMRRLDQDGFAALLDARDQDLSEGILPSGKTAPLPSYLVTLAATLEVYSSAKTKRERDPATGRLKLSFTEESGTAGNVTIPPAFLISVPVFSDGHPQLLEVRLRVTVSEGAASFEVQIHNAAEVLRLAFGNLCRSVVDATGLPLFVGQPEQ